MDKFLSKFEAWCKTPGIDSGKAHSYANSLEYLCEYLQIPEIDTTAISLLKSVENDINDKNSRLYKDFLAFLTGRGQKSYLTNGFVKAALKYLDSSEFLAVLNGEKSQNEAIDTEKNYKLGQFDSWVINDENTAVKHCDKSFFDHRGSGVPQGICWFFNADDMALGETKPITLIYEGKEYQGSIKNDTDRRRVRIFWNTELGNLLNAYNAHGARATFVRCSDDTYEISIEVQEIRYAYLLTWNPSAWNWRDYNQAVSQTHSGQPYNCRWSCTNTHVRYGDRVYLSIAGAKGQNGIIASGMAVSDSFVDSHWDPEKAQAGNRARFVRVDFDWINDFRQGNVLSQTVLKTKFPEQQWSPMASGIAISGEYIDALEDEWKNYNGLLGGETEMTIKEKVAAVKAYIAARGFNYEGDLIENFYLSLKSKPFVILAGTSGTGKTKLVEYFAEAIGAKMQLVPVRPDWSDSSDLFGHKDLSGNFHPGALIDFIKSATDSPSVPHFLCLDEMNLARVEYYMSDLLSIIETRRFNDQHKVVTKPLIAKDYCLCANGRNDYGELGIPDNLYIIGTVNMDETTFPFSKKVLDRANTIEFSFVDLTRKALPIVQYEAQELDNSFLKAEYLHLIDCGDDQLIDDICLDLNVWNQILVKANLHVGYRVRDEICFYMMNNKKSELLKFETAFDHEIMQKILPRIQGSSAAIKDVLSELFIKCAGDYTGFAGAAAYEQMSAYLDSKSCKYPNSAKKIAFMMRRYEEDGFTSYWL